MILQVRVAKVDDPKEGVSATTGKAWKQRNILLAFNDEEGDEYISVGVDEDTWRHLDLQEGQETTVRLKFYTRKLMSGYVSNVARIVSPQTAQ